METRGCIAEFRAGQLTVWSSTQVPHLLRLFYAVQMGISEDKVRVIAPRGRRRVRRQAAGHRRGDDVRLGVAQARPAGEVDRDALGEHGGLPPRPRPGRLRAHGRDAGRQDHRLPREHHPGPRRLLRAADADDPGARRVRDDRLLRDPRRADRHHRRADEQVLHRRDPRSGPPGDDAHARGHDRPARPGAGDGPRRGAPQELHQGRAVPLRDAVRHHV